ncbi:MAG: OsmC family protein [Gemmatimonadetes bacterium]|nr:OsmC family protein [Gemmatimonadota bacterium]
MSEHHATIAWQRGAVEFTYQEYSRDHDWIFPNGVEIAASAAPAFRGTPDRIDPEEAFVASLASCHMLTFLALAAREGIVVDGYQDSAVGLLSKDDEGRMAITRVTLRPTITFGGDPPAAADLTRLHQQAHHECFIANSVHTAITVEQP